MKWRYIRDRFNSIIYFEHLRYKTKRYVKSGGYLIDKNIIFIVFLPASDYYYLPYFQLYSYKNVIVNFVYSNSNLLLSKVLGDSAGGIICKKDKNLEFDENKRYVVFFDGQYTQCSKELRDYYKIKYPNCSIIFHIGDLLRTKKGINIENIKAFADLIVTYDHNDAEDYNLICHPDPYSLLPAEMLSSSYKTSDVIFYGYAKNRSKEVLGVYDLLKSNKIDCDFSIPDLRKEDSKNRLELAGAKFTPYLEYLKRVRNTNCILEIIQKGSRGCTFRTWEAITYNKKLITNNPSVRDEEFYNPQFIQVIDSIESIDVDWIKNEVDVDYEYAEKLSPQSCFHFYLKCLRIKA